MNPLIALIATGALASVTLQNESYPRFEGHISECYIPDHVKVSQSISNDRFALFLPDATFDLSFEGYQAECFSRGMKAYWSPTEVEKWHELTPESESSARQIKIMVVRDTVDSADLTNREKLREANQPYFIVLVNGHFAMKKRGEAIQMIQENNIDRPLSLAPLYASAGIFISLVAYFIQFGDTFFAIWCAAVIMAWSLFIIIPCLLAIFP